jgi:hypothetical protein
MTWRIGVVGTGSTANAGRVAKKADDSIVRRKVFMLDRSGANGGETIGATRYRRMTER